MVLAYNPSKKRINLFTRQGIRTVEAQVLTLPASYTGDYNQAFVSEDAKIVSKSVYLGFGTVTQ